MNWNKYFETIVDWKKLPAYRAEPRVDSLIGYYLHDILSDFLKIKIETIIPELPLRIGTIHPVYNDRNFADRSYKVDFFAIGNNGKNYLVEFKTDLGSLRSNQNDYLERSSSLGTKELVSGIIQISKASTFKKKYQHLIDKLRKAELIDDNNNYTGKNLNCEIIYVIPANNDNKPNTIDFKYIAEWLQLNNPDEFEQAFSNTLKLWHFEYGRN